MNTVNLLLRFKTLGTGKNYLFQADNGELFHIPSDDDYELLKKLYTDLKESADPSKLLSNYPTSSSISSDSARQLLFSEDTPPTLANDFDQPGFLNSIKGYMKLFFVFTTYNCNLNCSYCTYSGLYHRERGHLKLNMDSETVNQTVKIIRENSSKSENVTIVFYGDEPLINFNAIESLVTQLQNHSASSSITRFHIQIITNGLLLNKKKSDSASTGTSSCN